MCASSCQATSPIASGFLKIKLYVHTLFVLIIIRANIHLHNCNYFYNIKENTCVCCIFFEGMGSELFKTCLEEGGLMLNVDLKCSALQTASLLLGLSKKFQNKKGLTV